jgi:hypothetical protein
MVRRYGLVALLVAASIVTLSACGKPKAGGKCTAGSAPVCNDAKSALVCGSDGNYASINCGGPAGCAGTGPAVKCDESVATAGDACSGSSGYACAADMKNALQCLSNKFVLAETCKGPNACKSTAGEIFCDNDIADVNDPCRDDGDYACTGDKLAALQCKGKKMLTINSCRGPKSCAVVHKGKDVDIDCDMTVAAENDPCFFPNNEACTSDKKSMLTCKGGKYTSPTACPGANGCTVTVTAKQYKVTCDTEGGGGGGGGGGGKKGKKR